APTSLADVVWPGVLGGWVPDGHRREACGTGLERRRRDGGRRLPVRNERDRHGTAVRPADHGRCVQRRSPRGQQRLPELPVWPYGLGGTEEPGLPRSREG